MRGRAQVHRRTRESLGGGAGAAHVVGLLEHVYLEAGAGEQRRGGEPVRAGAHHSHTLSLGYSHLAPVSTRRNTTEHTPDANNRPQRAKNAVWSARSRAYVDTVPA